VADGQIDLKWVHEPDGQVKLHWTETGGPAVKAPTRKGFGGRIIEQMIGQLKGQTRFDWNAEGVVCKITLRV
jgi:two-component sensor histidine kinase